MPPPIPTSVPTMPAKLPNKNNKAMPIVFTGVNPVRKSENGGNYCLDNFSIAE